MIVASSPFSPPSPRSRLLSLASRASTFHDIPQMESLHAGFFSNGIFVGLEIAIDFDGRHRLLVKVCKNETDLSQQVVNQFFSWT